MSTELQHTLVGDVTKINSEACCNVNFNEAKDGFTVDCSALVKCELQGTKLVIKSKHGAGGSSVVISGGSIFSSFFGGSSVYYGGGDVSITNGEVHISSGGARDVYVDGRRIDTKSLAGPTSEEKEDKEYSKVWHITTTSKVSHVTLQGNGHLNFPYNFFTKSPTLNVSGSGGIYLSEMSFDSMKGKLTGSGDIDFGDSSADTVDVDLTGSGDIKNFDAIISASLNLTGSGDIRGRARKGCDIDRNKTGSGDIKVIKY